MWCIKNMVVLWGVGTDTEPAVGRALETVMCFRDMCPTGHGVLGIGEEEEKSLNQARF